VTANDTNVQNVTLNGTLMQPVSGTTYSLVSNASALGCASDGACTLTATILDKAGNSNSTTYTLTVDNTAPVISLNSPTNGASMSNTDGNLTVNYTLVETNPSSTNVSIDRGVFTNTSPSNASETVFSSTVHTLSALQQLDEALPNFADVRT
jgi:hypothetical protein